MRNADEVLELGTGYIDDIFVLVPDDDGRFQVAAGGVYSYYEFWNDQRLTDREWRALLDDGKAPDRPGWQRVFLAEPTGGVLAPGLFCRDLAAQGLEFTRAAMYWISEGSPERMDADRNGIPCETVFASDDIAAFLEGARSFDAGLTCEGLNLGDDSVGFQRAVAYWMIEATPERMDANGDGIPCDTTFSPSTIDAALGGTT